VSPRVHSVACRTCGRAVGLVQAEDGRGEARAARAVVEWALDRAGWPWSRRLSLWIDALVILGRGGCDDSLAAAGMRTRGRCLMAPKP
jgi:hypothetical protein